MGKPGEYNEKGAVGGSASKGSAGAGEHGLSDGGVERLIDDAIKAAMSSTPVVDIHTHLFPPGHKDLLLRGIDELLTYHYLPVEALRYRKMEPLAFFSMSKAEQADEVWRTLFVERSPISEACRGVITVLKAFGLDTGAKDLGEARGFFNGLTAEEHVGLVFEKANIDFAVMTNDPFDKQETSCWGPSFLSDRRFKSALRVDYLVSSPEKALLKMTKEGYSPGSGRDSIRYGEVLRFLDGCEGYISPLYAAVSLPPSFNLADGSFGSEMLQKAIIPFCENKGLPLALMIGVKRGVNPEMELGGDGIGSFDVSALASMCRDYPRMNFMVTLLSRENQHELCVAARKFPNLTPFGCWWFLNNPSLVKEITKMRLELLGLSFIPQHSDARVLDQLIYKWDHSRKVVASVLSEKYKDMARSGRRVEPFEIKRDWFELTHGNATRLFGMEEARS